MNFKDYGGIFGVTLFYMCVPPEQGSSQTAEDKAKIDSLRKVRCPRLMSSAAEYYRNRDWKQTVKIYKEITSLNCLMNGIQYMLLLKKYISIMLSLMNK